MKEGEQRPFFPKLRVRIKDNNSSPHGKFYRFLFPFFSTFSDLNFASYVLYIYLHTVSLGYLWLRYVDDTFTTLHKDEIDDFHKHLNRQNAHIQFTKEIEDNGKIPFLDCLVIRDNNRLQTTVYRKPTHTDRRIILQPFFTQSYNNTDLNETRATGL